MEVGIAKLDDSRTRLERIAEIARDALARCRRAGASQAEVGVNEDVGRNVNVRMGDVETIEHTRDRGLAVTVYFGQRKGSASTADLQADSIRTTVEQACAIARYTEADPCAGLANPERMATEFPEMDLWHPWDYSTEQAIALGIECEAAGRDYDQRIVNSDGATVTASESISVYGNSHGFVAGERGTRQMLSCSLIGEDAAGMQRDYWYTSTRSAADLESARAVGERAAQRTVARLGARQLSTRSCPVLFSAEVARGLIGHFLSAVSGGALYRKASFLLDHLGKPVFPEFVQIDERPHLRRGQGSSAFDAEGVQTRDSALIAGGELQRYVLGSYSARKLGMASTGNAGGIHNLVVRAGSQGFEDLLKELGNGFLVTEVMGQGVNIVTGDYSRGAGGFWVENGVIVHAVEEVTIAGKLAEMFRGIQAIGKDVDPRSHILCGSILIDKLTLAGS